MLRRPGAELGALGAAAAEDAESNAADHEHEGHHDRDDQLLVLQARGVYAVTNGLLRAQAELRALVHDRDAPYVAPTRDAVGRGWGSSKSIR